ncbi:hypothetical protein BCR44DRAFT_294536 [Catenaria anguillulae PL171]|uniref:Uncharacterized protein n=1 Tax=Catenaria anguillulae PL171 TaxID=765915 RepID=A0A1Y2I3K3_9FUNG|nr:hypothetical protein BCR44DRAFT_294536 [Catenaria anguillulae PL171]
MIPASRHYPERVQGIYFWALHTLLRLESCVSPQCDSRRPDKRFNDLGPNALEPATIRLVPGSLLLSNRPPHSSTRNQSSHAPAKGPPSDKSGVGPALRLALLDGPGAHGQAAERPSAHSPARALCPLPPGLGARGCADHGARAHVVQRRHVQPSRAIPVDELAAPHCQCRSTSAGAQVARLRDSSLAAAGEPQVRYDSGSRIDILDRGQGTVACRVIRGQSSCSQWR